VPHPASWGPAVAVAARLDGPGVGPLDAPVGDFGHGDSPKAWSAGLLRALLPIPWWPGMDVWEHAACQRLREAIVALHWYWLGELGRAYCPRHGVGDLAGARLCADCHALARETADPDARVARLAGQDAAAVAQNALDVLRFEVDAFDYALTRRELLEPTGRYVELGPALALARREHARVSSETARRWHEEVLRPGVDYAPSAVHFARGVAEVLERLVEPADAPRGGETSPPTAWTGQRARRVLRDLGWRLVTWAAATRERASAAQERGEGGGEDGLAIEHRDAVEHAVVEIAAVLAAPPAPGLEAATAPSRAAEALSAAALAVGDGPARVALAVGYAPLPGASAAEPAAMLAARRAAFAARLEASGSPLAAAVRYAPSVVDTALQRPRSEAPAGDLRAAVEPPPLAPGADIQRIRAAQKVYMRQALFEWLAVAAPQWASPPGEAAWQRPWWYELAEPPDVLTGVAGDDGGDASRLVAALGWRASLRVRPNPVLGGLPAPFDIRWVDDLLEGRADPAREPKYAVRAESVAVGRGRRGPVFVPLTEPRRELLQRLRHTPTVAALLEGGVRWPTLREAVARELVLCVHQRDPVDLAPGVPEGYEGADDGRGAREAGAGPREPAQGPESQGGTAPGANPWDDPAQAAYYAAFCDRWPVYDAVARALVEHAGLGGDAAVADLGVGSGVSTRAVLAALGPRARVVGVDPSARMVAQARARLDDERLVLAQGDARALLDLMPLGPGFDAVVASSSFWLDGDVVGALRAVFRVLRAGGVLALSFPAAHLGLPGAGESPGERAAAAALATLFGATRQGGGAQEPASGAVAPLPEGLGSATRLTRLLERVGFVDVEIAPFVHETTAAEYVAWLGQPAVLGRLGVGEVGGGLEASREALAAGVDGALPVAWRWALVRALVPR